MGFTILLLASTILLFSPRTSAWGANTHETIAQLALRYLLPETVEWLNKLLPDKGSTDEGMTFISTWPDGYAHQCVDGGWTRGLHFIDSRDVTAKTIKNPPLKCSVEMTRDCGNGYCVVGAIQNYVYTPCSPSLLTVFTSSPSCLTPLEHIDLHYPTAVTK